MKMNDYKVKEMLYSTWQREGGEAFIQMLLDKDININTWKNDGKTMLSYAAKWGDLQFVKFLVRNGAGGDVRNFNGSKPLHKACKYGHIDIVNFFLKLGVFVGSCDDNCRTSLHYAAGKFNCPETECERYIELIRFLVAKGANINVVDKEGYTPTLLAAENHNLDIVKLLIDLGASVKGRGKYGDSLLHYAAENGWEGIVQFLLEWRSDDGSWNGDLDIDAKNLSDETPLLLAAFSSHESIVKLLLKSGADIEGQINEDLTLLHLASEGGWLDVVKYLLKRGCDINAKSRPKETPLILATRGAHSEVALYLIESGADVDGYEDEEGYTSLHHACEQRLLKVVKSLLRKGCNINDQNIDGSTPLHLSVCHTNSDIVENLLKAGADLTKEDNCNSTAINLIFKELDSALKFGIDPPRKHLINIKLFLENGACFQSKDYAIINKNTLLKEKLLKDVKLCTLSVINYFNNVDLLRLYEIPMMSQSLPPIEHLKIVHGSNAAQNIAQSVNLKIQENGYCNVLNVHPIALKVLCIKSFLNYYDSRPTMLKNESQIARTCTINSAKKLCILKNIE